MRSNLPDKDLFLGKNVPGLSGYSIVAHIHSGGNGHLFRAHSDTLKHDLACKVIPIGNLKGAAENPPGWVAEIHRANILRHPSVVKISHSYIWKESDLDINCVVFCSEFIVGPNLKKYIADNIGDISISFVMEFLRTMLGFFDDMAKHGVTHGDLHSENILVEDRSGLLGDSPHAFRVTDFGVISATGDRTLRDDYGQLAIIIKDLLAQANYQQASPRDKYVFNWLNDWLVPRGLLETDVTREPNARNPRLLFDLSMHLDTDFTAVQQKQEREKLTTPFDYLSCEQIGENHSLLKALYSERFLGLGVVQERNNLVLTGPRGCGKSTVFRSLSLRHRFLVDDDTPDKVEYIGIYYRCDDLYYAFPRYILPRWKEAYDIPVHFLTATLLIELLETVERWSLRHFDSSFRDSEQAAAKQLWEELEIHPPSEPSANTLKSVADRLRKERKESVVSQRFANDRKRGFHKFFGPQVLLRACEAIKIRFPFLGNRPFVYFIDDYSAPKITLPLQENLNRLVMQRTASCFFKLSTESTVSYARRDIDDKSYVEKREFVLLNLGLTYLGLTPLREDAENKLRFIEDIFSRRLKAVPGYPVKELEELVGNQEVTDNAMARALRKKEMHEVWGKSALAKLCSGDIHYVIDLVGKMVELAGGSESLKKTPRIPESVQNKAVRRAAGDFLQNLGRLPRGDRLVEVVTAFGNVAHSYLQYKDSKNEDGNPPHQASRVEPYEPLDLTPKEQSIYDELLRYSVFIEDVRGKSRRGKVVPRLYLRRFLIPHFNLTFSMRDSLELEPAGFKLLLTSPAKFENNHKLRKGSDIKKPGSRSDADGRRPLFDPKNEKPIGE